MPKRILFFLLFFCFALFSHAQYNHPYAPVKSFVTADSIILFQWNSDLANGGTTSYHLQIAEDKNFTNVFYDNNSLGTAEAIVSFPAFSGQYYWRVRSFNGTYSDWSVAWDFRLFSPNSNSNVGLWLDADSGIVLEGGKVREWQDLSPQNNDMYQYDTNLQPDYIDSVINNKDAIDFTTSLKYLNFTDTIDTLGGSLFTVIQNLSGVSGSYFIGFTNYESDPGLFVRDDYIRFRFNGNRSCLVSPLSTSNFSLISVKQDTVFNSTIFNSYYAKIKHNQTIGDSITSYGYHFGMNWLGKSRYYGSERNCNGYMAELIYYYAPLNDSLYALNEQYLRHKYAPAVNLGADIIVKYGFGDTAITAADHFTNYLWSSGDSSQNITVNRSGFYSLTATDIFGFESIDSIYVRYMADFSLRDTTICFGDSIIASVSLDSSYAFLWSDASTDSLLEISTAGTYWLEVTDSLGFSIRDSFVVVVDSFPHYADLGADISVCEGEEITLLSGASEAVSYLWNTGETTTTKQIDTSGVYSLIVSDSFGCTAYDTISVTVSGLIPNTGFIADSSCFGLATQFTDTSNIIAPWNIVSWEWVFNETDTLSVQHPQYTFSNSGNQQVRLKVVTDSGCVGSFSDSVFVIPLPQADFSPEQGCNGQQIQFTDLSSSSYGTVNNWKWNFNNPFAINDSSIIQHPTHQYDSSGTYLCRLIVENEFGCVDSLSKNILIKNTPQADFSFQDACALENIFFSDETQTTSWENILYWNWDLGNGNTSNIPNPYQSYDNAGNYTVSLKVFSINGCSDSVSKIVEVFPLPNAHFFWDNHCVGQDVRFFDSSTVSSGNIANWDWDLSGNLGQSNDQNPLNSYPDSGNYSVKLTVVTDKGCSDNTSNTISIFPVPTADFSIDPEYGIPPINIAFTNNSIGADDYIWDFGDGSIISGISDPSYVYSDTGLYDACLIAINSYFCYDTLCKTVYMIPSYFDVAIDRVIVLDTVNQQIKIEARIVNAGNRKIEQLFLHGQLGSNPPLVEEWSGELMPGEFVDYEFNARFLLSSHLNCDYVCVRAEIPGNFEDDNPNNNKACASVTQNFVVGEIYPNPSSSWISIPVNIPESDDLNISIFNTQGQIVAILINKRTDAGFINIEFDVKSLASGIYYLVSKYQNKEDVKKIMVY